MKTHKYYKAFWDKKERVIIVNTPKPYEIKIEGRPDLDTEEKIYEMCYKLNEHICFLYDCIRGLGITKREAEKLGLTLNYSTGEKLLDICCRKIKKRQLSRRFRDMIRDYDW